MTLEESLQLVVLSRAKTVHAPGSQGSSEDAISITYNAMWDPSSDPCLSLRLRRLHSERTLAAFEIRTTVSPCLFSQKDMVFPMGDPWYGIWLSSP